MSPLTRYTLYTNPSLPCPQRVHLTIAELNISARFTFISVDLRNKPASLLSLSPSGAVPVLVEHNTTSNGNNEGADFVLNESRAIARYLVLMHGFRSQHAVEPEVGLARSKLIADETWERRDVARFEEAASVEVTGWDPVANKLVFEMAFKEIFGLGGRDVQLIERLWAELDRILDVLEGDRRRRRRKWVVGEVSRFLWSSWFW